MGAYILRRLLLIIPTLLGIMVINFALVQFVPGGPIEQIICRRCRARATCSTASPAAATHGVSDGAGSDSEYAGCARPAARVHRPA